jgi:hypothetical protein
MKQKTLPSTYFAGIFTVVLSVGLIGCSGSDIVSNDSPNANRLLMRDVMPPGPSHEVRLFVSTDGVPVGMEVVRIKSVRKDFKAKSADGAGKRLDHVPAKASEIASKLSGRPGLISLVIYEKAAGWRRPARSMSNAISESASQTSSLGSLTAKATAFRTAASRPLDEGELPWLENPDAMSMTEHEAYVDDGMAEIVAIGDDVLAQYPIPEPDPEPSDRAGGSIMFVPDAIDVDTRLIVNPLALALSMSMNCTLKKAVVIAAGMALPSAGAVIASRAAIVSGVVAAATGYVDYFVDWLNQC